MVRRIACGRPAARFVLLATILSPVGAAACSFEHDDNAPAPEPQGPGGANSVGRGEKQGGTGGNASSGAGGIADTCDGGDPDASCVGVTCAAFAHCDSGECVCNTGYQGDPASGCTPVPDELAALRQELVEIAEKEVGVCEGVDSRPYIDAAPGLWCYAFVAWVYNQSSWELPSPNSLPKHPMPIPDDWRPQPGDLVKYQIQHFGMVVSVDPDGRLHTIEGNSSYCVRENTTWVNFAEEYYGSLENVLAP